MIISNNLAEFENFEKKITNFTCYMLNKSISKYWLEKLNNKMNFS